MRISYPVAQTLSVGLDVPFEQPSWRRTLANVSHAVVTKLGGFLRSSGRALKITMGLVIGLGLISFLGLSVHTIFRLVRKVQQRQRRRTRFHDLAVGRAMRPDAPGDGRNPDPMGVIGVPLDHPVAHIHDFTAMALPDGWTDAGRHWAIPMLARRKNNAKHEDDPAIPPMALPPVFDPAAARPLDGDDFQRAFLRMDFAREIEFIDQVPVGHMLISGVLDERGVLHYYSNELVSALRVRVISRARTRSLVQGLLTIAQSYLEERGLGLAMEQIGTISVYLACAVTPNEVAAERILKEITNPGLLDRVADWLVDFSFSNLVDNLLTRVVSSP